MPKPSLKIVKSRRSPAREALAERIAAAKEAQADVREADHAIDRARNELTDARKDLAALNRDAAPSPDERIAAFAKGRVDVTAESRAERDFAAKANEIRKRIDNLEEVLSLAEKSLPDRTRKAEYARRAVEEAARVVAAEVADLDALDLRVTKAKAALEAALRDVATVYSVAPHNSVAGNRAKRMLAVGVAVDYRDLAGVESPLRRLHAALTSDPDATL